MILQVHAQKSSSEKQETPKTSRQKLSRNLLTNCFGALCAFINLDNGYFSWKTISRVKPFLVIVEICNYKLVKIQRNYVLNIFHIVTEV